MRPDVAYENQWYCGEGMGLGVRLKMLFVYKLHN